MQKIEYIDINKLIPHPNNPRIIKDEQFKKLCKSIQDNKDYFETRPILVNKDLVIFAGNMRWRAGKEVGMIEVPVSIMDISEERQKELMIRDNRENGEWDWDLLANEWNLEDLVSFGFDEAELLRDMGLDKIEDIEVDENRLFVLTVEAPEAPKLKERMAFYCENIEDYNRVKDYFEKSKSELDVNKLLEII